MSSGDVTVLEELLRDFSGIHEEIINFRSEVSSASALGRRLMNEYDVTKRKPLEAIVQHQLASLQVGTGVQ